MGVSALTCSASTRDTAASATLETDVDLDILRCSRTMSGGVACMLGLEMKPQFFLGPQIFGGGLVFSSLPDKDPLLSLSERPPFVVVGLWGIQARGTPSADCSCVSDGARMTMK